MALTFAPVWRTRLRLLDRTFMFSDRGSLRASGDDFRQFGRSYG